MCACGSVAVCAVSFVGSAVGLLVDVQCAVFLAKSCSSVENTIFFPCFGQRSIEYRYFIPGKWLWRKHWPRAWGRLFELCVKSVGGLMDVWEKDAAWNGMTGSFLKGHG